MAEVFGEAANALFTVNGGAAFIGGNLQAGAIQLGGPVGAALSWVMAAYMIYRVAVILIQLIWTCEQEEFELRAKRELRACYDVGSYCKSKVLSACSERRKAYCCFNTPLARILNEQIRPQLGRAWGEADEADCTGIAVANFGRVDWDRANLDEWPAILAEYGERARPVRHAAGCRRAQPDALGWAGYRRRTSGGGDGAVGVDAAGVAVTG